MSNLISVPENKAEKQKALDRNQNARIEPSFGSGDTYKYDMNYHKMADFLGLKKDDKMDFDIAQKVAYLRDFTKEKDELDAMVKIRDVIKQLGVTFQGKELVNHLYKYTRLYQDRIRVDKEISLLVDSKPHEQQTHRERPQLDSTGGA